MTEIVLFLVIATLVVLIGYMDWNNRKERKAMLNAILAKNNQELVNLELAEKTKIETSTTENEPEFADQSSLNNEEWAAMEIKKET